MLYKKIREIRKKQGMTQAQLSVRSGISVDRLGGIEVGNGKISVVELERVFEILGAKLVVLEAGQRVMVVNEVKLGESDWKVSTVKGEQIIRDSHLNSQDGENILKLLKQNHRFSEGDLCFATNENIKKGKPINGVVFYFHNKEWMPVKAEDIDKNMSDFIYHHYYNA